MTLSLGMQAYMVQLGLLRVKADSAQPPTPRGPANQQAQPAEPAPGGSAAEAAMQLSTGDPAPQQPAAALAEEAPPEPTPQPADGEQSMANGDLGAGAADAPAGNATDQATVAPAGETDAEDVDVDMDIDPTAGVRPESCCAVAMHL